MHEIATIFHRSEKMMLVYDEQYLKSVRALLGSAQHAQVAVAFWGLGAESIFKGWHGESLRIICNLALGGTNPEVVLELKKLPGAEVRQLNNLHAKLVLTDEAMVLGSANISTNGLGLENSEGANFQELGMQTKNPRLLKDAGAWFDARWESALPIKRSDLESAREAWARRRSTRPATKSTRTRSLLKLSPDMLKDRAIYFAIYRSKLTPEALDRLEKENEKLASQLPPEQTERHLLDLYEGWEADDLPKDPNAIIFPIYWGSHGKVEVSAPQRPVPELEESHRPKGKVWRLDFTAIVKNPATLGLPFKCAEADRMELVQPVGEWLESIRGQLDDHEPTLCVPVYEFLRWRAAQSN